LPSIFLPFQAVASVSPAEYNTAGRDPPDSPSPAMRFGLFCFIVSFGAVSALAAEPFEITENDEQIKIVSPEIEAVIKKKGYVSGVAGGTFLDKKTGFRDVGFGLDIVDWIMEPGSDEAYRDKLPDHMVYQFGNDYHGKTPKRSIEGPQICTKARELQSEIVRGKGFVAVKLWYHYTLAAPGKKPGSKWTQWLVFPAGKRYFVSSDRIDAVNSSDAMFLRIDMPGHIKHNKGDTFSEVYLSYQGRLPSKEFLVNFPPDGKFNYRRDKLDPFNEKPPERMIRGYKLRDPKDGRGGPWLAGMTLDPKIVSEAWCHQRGYVCMIEEFGGRPVKAGESFSAAFIVGFFDSLEEMHSVYDAHKGSSGLAVDKDGWKFTK
jgi:hypothetical protein